MKTKRLLVVALGSVLILLVAVIFLVTNKGKNGNNPSPDVRQETDGETETEEPTMDPFLTGNSISQEWLPVNEYSRPGTALTEVNAIVIHYVGNPGTTAAQNRDYFASLAETGETSASSHFIIGLSGEIIQCIPLTEIAYASNQRNGDTISIECCHPDEDGHFTAETYQSLVILTAALCRSYGLDAQTGVIRHYDVTQKKCPLYYVEHEDAWLTFLADIQARIRLSE